MSQNISLWGASYSNVPSVTLPKTGGGTASFTDVTDTTATASDVASGKYFYTAAGAKVQGSIATKTASDLSANGKTVTVPAGYYASQATKDVATGTAGTPTATKGTVSNHSVSVTPSVTNTSGYITGSTKTGTAVTVSASELVSGNKAITSNGTNIDVANYSTCSVSVAGTPNVTRTYFNNPASGAARTSISFTDLGGEPAAFALRFGGNLSRNSQNKYYYILCITYDGTYTEGTFWRQDTGAVFTDTTHYSYTYSNGTLTVSSSGSRTGGDGGSFCNGTYYLTYIY